MANTKRNRKVHAAGILLSLCALGGIAAAAPNVIFSPDAVITASASFDIGDFSVSENTTDKTVTVLSYHGSGGAVTLPLHTGLYRPANGYKYIVDENAFQNNANITKVTIPSAYIKIGKGAFSGCTKLTTVVTTGGDLATIGEDAFKNCSKLTTLNLSEGLKTIDKNAFTGTALTKLQIPGSLESIGYSAFKGVTTLTSVDYLSNVKYNTSHLNTIMPYAFMNCSGLNDLCSLPTAVTYLGREAFRNCTSLTKLDLDYINVTTIPPLLAHGCTKMEIVYLPQKVQKIEINAFGKNGIANSKSDHAVEIRCLSRTSAINTSNGTVKSRVVVLDTSGNENNWGGAFYDTKKIIFKGYPNSALDYGYHSYDYQYAGRNSISKYPNNSASGITSEFMYYSNNNLGTVSYWDGETSTVNRLCTFLKDIPYPLPGKINDNDLIAVNDGYEDIIKINSVTCKDAAGNTLADGKPFGQGTTYYYEVKIQPKSSSYNFNLENMKYNNTGKIKVLGQKDKSGKAKTAYAYANVVGISLGSADALPVVTLRCYADLSDYEDANGNEPYSDSWSGSNGSNLPKDLYGANTHTLYYLRAPHPYVDDTTAVNTKPRVTLDLEPVTDEVNKGNLFDQSKYWNAGAAKVYYAYREKGTSTALNYSCTWILENLEPEKTYNVYFSSNSSDANRFYTYEFKAPPVLKVKGANLNLSDVLGLKFNLEPTASFIKSDAKATFKVKHGNSYVNVTSAIPATNTDGVYAFPVLLNAKEMYDPVTLNGYSASGLSSDWALVLGKKCTYLPDKTFTYTVMEYLNSAVSNPSITPKNRALAQATKDYGIMVMKRLNYNTNLITSADETAALENISDVTAYDFEQFAPVKSGSTPAGFKGVGASFECKSASVFNVKFNVLAGHTIDEFTIKCTDPKGRTTTITPVLSADTENQYVYSITGLTAKQLSDQYTFTVSGGGKTFTIKVSSMSYFYAQRNNSDPNVTNLGKAVYLYNQAANA